MTPRPLRVGTRPWDHVSALASRDVPTPLTVDHRQLEATPHLWETPELDVAETSFSRYVRARAAGDDRVTGLPLFVMRGFRHRCILVRAESSLSHPSQLRGTRIGLTGWPDSGNTWTRALLLDAGVKLGEVHWRVGPLTPSSPAFDRMGGTAPGPWVSEMVPGDSLVTALKRGDLDAIMTPFMPPGFYHGTALRTLYPDTQAVEEDYYSQNNFVPGMHLIAVRTELVERSPELTQQLMDLFEQAKLTSFRRRNKLQDIFPWHDRELARTIAVFGGNWMPYGWRADAAMIAAFQRQLVDQGLLDAPVTELGLFPHQLEPQQSALEEHFV